MINNFIAYYDAFFIRGLEYVLKCGTHIVSDSTPNWSLFKDMSQRWIAKHLWAIGI